MRRMLAIALLAAAVACSNNAPSSSPTTTPSPTPQHTQIGGVDAIVRGRLDISQSQAAITIQDNYFTPNVLTAKAGSTIAFTFTNHGTGLHNVSVDAQSISKDFQPGFSTSVSIKVPASGRLVFYCKYHKDESGMVGAIDAT